MLSEDGIPGRGNAAIFGPQIANTISTTSQNEAAIKETMGDSRILALVKPWDLKTVRYSSKCLAELDSFSA